MPNVRIPRRAVVPTGIAAAMFVTLALLVVLAWPAPASAQLRRCERPDGTTAFTDRQCTEIGAVEQEPSHARPGSRRIYRGGCARSVQDLLFEMSTAIDAGDANRLASVYHWPGMSSRTATTVMERLDRVAQRPLIDIVPVWPSAPRTSGFAPSSVSDLDAASLAAAASGPAAPAADYQYPTTAGPSQAPVAVRVVQTLDNASTPSETVFQLHRHFGCVWIKD